MPTAVRSTRRATRGRRTDRSPGGDLLCLQGMGAERVRGLLESARDLSRAGARGDELNGRQVANLFFEDSTRTRLGISVAAQRLGARVVDLLGQSSSVNKGETLIDTARNVEAMGVDAMVVRARQSGAAAAVAAAVAPPVINAGDGRHEHPTQGLSDLYTLAEAHGRLGDFDLSGLSVAIVGDVASSRVARSAIAGITALGGRAVCVGPPGLVHAGLEALGARVEHDLGAVLPEADAVMMLRIQFERQGEGRTPGPASSEAPRGSPIASVREYRALYALTAERAALMKPRAVVLHPGPINRGIELDAAVADGPRGRVLRQVQHGVWVRMAVLLDCLRG
jgi:aspartate carbamoyltransferase catalytic subunit